MVTSPDQLYLLLDLQQQRFRKSRLNVLDKLRTRLLNLPCFGDVTEIDGLISHLHTELENDCRMYECANKSLYESLTSSNANEAVVHDPSSGPEMSISETCPVVGSSPIASETLCTDTELSRSQEDDVILNADKCIAVPVHKETEIYIESTYPVSNDIVPDMGSDNNAHNFDEISYKNEENMSAESNDGQRSNLILFDVDFPNDPLLADEILNEFENNTSEELNSDLKSKIVHYHLVISSGFYNQCEKHVLNKVELIVTWGYEDPTLFRGGGWTRKIFKIRIFKKGGC
ncbi:unnamed protein product [Schistosoma margrebowiei]|uniref:Uncharacterized protein n=1 Tax=Schistosoma margrebowiei TaxID=48269 RepID=A0A183MFH2_9TREM|nr:unnamed protein product [Schistosoma margrebowiei]